MKAPLFYLLLWLSLLSTWTFTSYAFVIPDQPQLFDSNGVTTHQLDNATFLLEKRGCVLSKIIETINNLQEPVYVCTTEVPSVDDIVAILKAYGKVGNRDSMFYNDLQGASAIVMAKGWYCSNVRKGRGSVTWDDITNNKWYKAQGEALYSVPSRVDQFQKRLAQAFATASSGTVYFFTKQSNDGTNVDPIWAWGGWEYPALTRNPDVTEIIQVDPTVEGDLGHIIWKKGDGPSPNEPRG